MFVRSQKTLGDGVAVVSEEWLWLDELCNGLLSQAKFHKFFARQSKPIDELCILKPELSPVSYVFVWFGSGVFPVKRVLEINPETNCKYFRAGEFSNEELLTLKSHFAEIKPWNEGSSKDG